jgi:hypothetical protein
MSNRAPATHCGASVRVAVQRASPFSENSYYYHGLLVLLGHKMQ